MAFRLLSSILVTCDPRPSHGALIFVIIHLLAELLQMTPRRDKNTQFIIGSAIQLAPVFSVHGIYFDEKFYRKVRTNTTWEFINAETAIDSEKVDVNNECAGEYRSPPPPPPRTIKTTEKKWVMRNRRNTIFPSVHTNDICRPTSDRHFNGKHVPFRIDMKRKSPKP